MIIEVQQAVVDFLKPILAENDALAGVVYEVRPALEDASNPMPGDRHVVVVMCREARAALTDLRECMMEIFVSTPVDVVTVAGAAALESAVHACFQRGETANIDALLDAAVTAAVNGWTYAGYYCEGWREGREETAHLPTLTVKMGMIRATV